jgi:hypothetical protein
MSMVLLLAVILPLSRVIFDITELLVSFFRKGAPDAR